MDKNHFFPDGFCSKLETSTGEDTDTLQWNPIAFDDDGNATAYGRFNGADLQMDQGFWAPLSTNTTGAPTFLARLTESGTPTFACAEGSYHPDGIFGSAFARENRYHGGFDLQWNGLDHHLLTLGMEYITTKLEKIRTAGNFTPIPVADLTNEMGSFSAMVPFAMTAEEWHRTLKEGG